MVVLRYKLRSTQCEIIKRENDKEKLYLEQTHTPEPRLLVA
jgi:hypothetical protein